MRHTTRLSLIPSLLGLSLAACVPQVDSGPSTRPHTTDGTCNKQEEPVMIRTMADFDGLPTGCWDLFGTLTVQGSEITSIAKLGELAGINDLQLINTKLTTLDAAKPLKVYGQVEITGNTMLKDLKNLVVEHADDLPVQVTVEDNDALASIDGLVDLTRIEGNLSISNNPKLAAVSLRHLTQVDGTIKVSNNPALTSIDLAKLGVASRIEVTSNVALTSFAGFDASSLTGDLIFRGNRALTTLGTLGSLEQLQGGLTIDDNDALTTVALFGSSMRYLTGALTVTNNGGLADLGQISHLQGIGTITINTNPNLSQCLAQEVEQCVPQHGAVQVAGNKPATNCTYWCK